jgi:hypothetical protein
MHLHEKSLLDIDRRIGVEVHPLGLVDKPRCVDPNVDDGRHLLIAVLKEYFMENDEDLADRTEHSLYVLAVSGLVGRLSQQLPREGYVQLLSLLHLYQQFSIVVLVGDCLSV